MGKEPTYEQACEAAEILRKHLRNKISFFDGEEHIRKGREDYLLWIALDTEYAYRV